MECRFSRSSSIDWETPSQVLARHTLNGDAMITVRRPGDCNFFTDPGCEVARPNKQFTEKQQQVRMRAQYPASHMHMVLRAISSALLALMTCMAVLLETRCIAQVLLCVSCGVDQGAQCMCRQMDMELCSNVHLTYAQTDTWGGAHA
jgi:hypothetical protein